MYFHSMQKLDALFLASICVVSLAIQVIGLAPTTEGLKSGAHADVGPHKGGLIEPGGVPAVRVER